MKLIEIMDHRWTNNKIIQEPDHRYGPDAGAEDIIDEYNIVVNGSLWKKNGSPVLFTDRKSADKAASLIFARYGKSAQVAPAGMFK